MNRYSTWTEREKQYEQFSRYMAGDRNIQAIRTGRNGRVPSGEKQKL